jgi:2-dehydro-3-deoxyphosphogluconate aldolase/(4S)-4-hydroxy-2-oxoglutarate aldolase
VKLFPASVAGPAFVRELRGPFPQIPLLPSGGVTAETAPDFIRAGAIAVGLGSWLIGDGDLQGIVDRSETVVRAVEAARRPSTG